MTLRAAAAFLALAAMAKRRSVTSPAVDADFGVSGIIQVHRLFCGRRIRSGASVGALPPDALR